MLNEKDILIVKKDLSKQSTLKDVISWMKKNRIAFFSFAFIINALLGEDKYYGAYLGEMDSVTHTRILLIKLPLKGDGHCLDNEEVVLDFQHIGHLLLPDTWKVPRLLLKKRIVDFE